MSGRFKSETSALQRIFGWAAVGAFVAVAAASCSSDTAGSTIPPCEQELTGLCGAACTADNQCPDNQYCGGDGVCTADCSAGDSRCPAGQVCGTSGRCAPGTIIDPGGSGGSSTGSGGSGTCIDVDVPFGPQTPTVILLVDQSGSMIEDFGGMGNRWQVLRTALMDPTTGIVALVQNQVRFGLALYTSLNGNDGGECPMLTEVPIALNNHAAINGLYSGTDYTPNGDTPTGDSIEAVAQTLLAFQEPGAKVIVLATDGEPDTCSEPDPQNGQDESIAAAQAAFTQGIFTYVISVGNDVGEAHLQDMANAGQGLQVGGGQNALFYRANNQSELQAAFASIIDGVRSCVLGLGGTVVPGREAEGTVTLDGVPLGYQDPNGWRLTGPSQLELLGTACETIKVGEHAVDITFPCGGFLPPR